MWILLHHDDIGHPIGISQTTIAPFPTINNVQVQDWVIQGFESFGGISGTISLFSLVLVGLYKAGDSRGSNPLADGTVSSQRESHSGVNVCLRR